MRSLLLIALAGAGALALAASAATPPPSTMSGMIIDRNGDGLLEHAPGEQVLVRDDFGLGGDRARNPSAAPLLFFAQMTDFQLVDEESPARVELVDKYGGSLNAAYRPQEGLLPFVVEKAVQQLRRARSRSGGSLELVMVTGDNIDNTQLNETEWYIRLLDGGLVDPNSGTDRGVCRVRNPRARYHGVRGSGQFYEPDRSGRGIDGPGYSSDRNANRRVTGRRNVLRDYPGLFELMNRPFRASGLRLPWYTVFGNHDGLVQGNVAYNVLFATAAMGCVKPVRLSRAGRAEAEGLVRGGITLEERGRIIQILTRDLVETVLGPQLTRDRWVAVLSDARRRLLQPAEYMQLHFQSRGRPLGHGFTRERAALGQGFYSFTPKPGIRFITLDTVADSGDQGNLDEAQFRWAESELTGAASRGELIFVFGHHPITHMTQAAPGVHLGRGDCTATPEPVECLFLRFPVLAYVAGHAHRNRIQAYRAPQNSSRGFWEIVTAAHTDYPQQSRLLEIIDNGSCVVSMRTSVVDHGAPPRPGSRPRRRGRLLSAAEVEWLASVGRELAYNDPQEAAGARRGARADRNVELLVRDPRCAGR